jgi:hypothetical protein
MKPSEIIDRKIAGILDWRGKTFATVRKAILAADPEIVEEWKFMGSPVWYRHGIILVGNAHKDKVKLTFANGAKIEDPDKLFNNGFGGSKWRAIDLYEGDKVNERALTNLVRSAIAYNASELEKKPTGSRAKAPTGTRKKAAATTRSKTPVGTKAKASTGGRAKAASGTRTKARTAKKA